MHISVYLAYLQLDVLKVRAGIIEPLPEEVQNGAIRRGYPKDQSV